MRKSTFWAIVVAWGILMATVVLMSADEQQSEAAQVFGKLATVVIVGVCAALGIVAWLRYRSSRDNFHADSDSDNDQT